MASRKKRRQSGTAGDFAYEGIDRVLHEKARLSILTALVTRAGGIRFTDLRHLCVLTDGNLSRHLQVLKEAGLVEIWKGHEGRRPQTLVRMTASGRREFLAYLEELERVIDDARSRASAPERFVAPPGWSPA